mgnify:FL=1
MSELNGFDWEYGNAARTLVCGTGPADASEATGTCHGESLMLTPRFYHTPHGCPRFLTPASSRACDEERAPSQATPPLR